MVKENKFFKVPGKTRGFYFERGKIDNLKENDVVFIWCAKWSLYRGKVMESFWQPPGLTVCVKHIVF